MRFMARGLFGLILLTLTLAILGVAGASLMSTMQERADRQGRPSFARERVFSVDVATITPMNIAPEIRSYGEVISGQTLELRAAATGEIVQLSENFREGASVRQGELLFQTDPAAAQSRLMLARTELAEAQSDLADANADYALTQADVTAAEKQVELREQALARQENLVARGVGTDAALEAAALSAASAEQTLVSKRLSLSQSRSRIARAENALARTQINLEDAQRLLDDATVYAEFDGVLSDVNAVLGGLVNVNERLGSLIDPGALEVSFRISNTQFGHLSAHEGGLNTAQVRVHFTGLAEPLDATLERVGAAVGEGQTGRNIFATLSGDAATAVRPGDFVAVSVTEPELTQAARVPATAVSGQSRVLVVGAENRLEEIDITVLRSQGDALIIDARPIAGRDLVLARAPQLGAGIRVEPRNSATAGQQQAAVLDDGTMEISDEMRAAMIAFVEGAQNMPQDRKDRILAALQQPRPPRQLVERISSRMGG